MRSIVLKYGFISGGMLVAMFLATFPFHDAESPDANIGVLVGYTTMVVAFLMVYFGVRRYRDTIGAGTVSFGRAVKVGALIAFIASSCYVASWQVIYFNFAPDYLDKYNEKVLADARAEGATDAELETKRAEMAKFMELYQNPAFNALVTFAEPLPVALLFTLVSAGLLSRKRKEA